MRCLECGYRNPEGTESCSKCGTSLSEALAPPPPPPPPPPPQMTVVSGSDEGTHTMRGVPASTPAWDSPPLTGERDGGGSAAATRHQGTGGALRCEACGFYPLRSAPSGATPCPNCGATSTVAEGRATPKTMRVDALAGAPPDPVRVTLTDVRTGKAAAYEGVRIEVGRESLDPEDATISSGAHLVFEASGGSVTVRDESSTGASYIQLQEAAEVRDGVRMVIGNRIYEVRIH